MYSLGHSNSISTCSIRSPPESNFWCRLNHRISGITEQGHGFLKTFNLVSILLRLKSVPNARHHCGGHILPGQEGDQIQQLWLPSVTDELLGRRWYPVTLLRLVPQSESSEYLVKLSSSTLIKLLLCIACGRRPYLQASTRGASNRASAGCKGGQMRRLNSRE